MDPHSPPSPSRSARREPASELRVDVAMAVCDGERYLGEQLRSIAEQSLAPARLLVHDDASTDRCAEILERFAAGAPFPVQVQRAATRIGAVRSFETALAACDADVVALCDQDDRWHHDRLARLVEPFAAGAADDDEAVRLAYTDGRLIDAAGHATATTIWQAFAAPDIASAAGPATFLRTLVSPFVPGCTIAISGRLLATALPFPPALSLDAVGLEHDGWLAGLAWAQGTVVALPEPLIDYRIHAAQQIGVPARERIAARVRRPGAALRHQRSQLVRRAAAAHLLREGLGRLTPTERTRDCAAQLDALVAHLDARRQLPASPLARAAVVYGLWRSGEYRRFSSGVRSGTLDLLAPSRSAPPPS